MEPVDRVYTVVDSGLSAGAQIAQTSHAVAQLSVEHPELFREWVTGGNTIICLEASFVDLLDFGYQLVQASKHMEDVRMAWFNEPDFDGKLTAFSVFGTEYVQFALTELTLAQKPSKGRLFEWRARKREAQLRAKNRLEGPQEAI